MHRTERLNAMDSELVDALRNLFQGAQARCSARLV
jgi:enoyl-CoA hydratase/carnithine racemase